MTFGIQSDRLAAIATLSASNANLDGAQSIEHGLPSALGDVAILAVSIAVADIATIASNTEIIGPWIAILTEGSVVDDLGTLRWTRTQGVTNLNASIQFDRPVYMYAHEKVRFVFGEVDENASPTADVTFLMRVKRLRNLSPGERQQYVERVLGW